MENELSDFQISAAAAGITNMIITIIWMPKKSDEAPKVVIDEDIDSGVKTDPLGYEATVHDIEI